MSIVTKRVKLPTQPTPEHPAARFDDLDWGSTVEDSAAAVKDRRPKWLRSWLPVSFGSSRPMDCHQMAKIKMAAYH